MLNLQMASSKLLKICVSSITYRIYHAKIGNKKKIKKSISGSSVSSLPFLRQFYTVESDRKVLGEWEFYSNNPGFYMYTQG